MWDFFDIDADGDEDLIDLLLADELLEENQKDTHLDNDYDETDSFDDLDF